MRSKIILIRDLVALTALASLPAIPGVPGVRRRATTDDERGVTVTSDEPRLVGRAVLPADTLADGPPSGAAIPSANGITFPRPSQPVEGFSAIVDGRRPARSWRCPTTATAPRPRHVDFLIRAYYIRPDFKTASRRTGAVHVGQFIQFRDPFGVIGFPIVNEGEPRIGC